MEEEEPTEISPDNAELILVREADILDKTGTPILHCILKIHIHLGEFSLTKT